MAEPWWKAKPADLQRVSERISTLYVERCHIDRDENAVTVVNREETVHVPAAMLAVLMLGPGTRVTHAAIALLADSGTAVCWVGDRGVRMYAAGLGASRGGALVLRQAWLATRQQERLRVARRMYAMRFPDEDVSAMSMRQLRGREGARVRSLYREHSKRTGVPWTRREYTPGAAAERGDDVNRLLSACNATLYGLVHAAVAGIGASPALGFVHTGGAMSFVHDIADLHKAELSIPIAFDLAASGRVRERDARLAMRDAMRDARTLPQVVAEVLELLEVDESETGADLNELWDGEQRVTGGRNWSTDDVPFTELSGPELASPPEAYDSDSDAGGL